MQPETQLWKERRYGRLLEALDYEYVDWKPYRDAFEAAHKLAGDRLREIDESDPSYRSLERIADWNPDHIDRALRRGTLFREFVELLCDLFSVRDTRRTLSVSEKADLYFQWIMNDIPPGVRAAKNSSVGVANDIFPFSQQTLDDITDADADLFYSASPQGIGAVAERLDVGRDLYRTELAQMFTIESTVGTHPAIYYLGGPSGSGKTVLLDRIALDTLQSGKEVYRCQTAYADPASFFDRLHNVLGRMADDGVIIFDDAHNLVSRGVSLEALEAFAVVARHRVVLLMTGNWHLHPNSPPLSLPASARARRLRNLGGLSDFEILGLSDKLIAAERSGAIKEIRCDLPASQRISLLTNDRERLILLALFKLRYAQNIREVLRRDYAAITDARVRQIYGQTALLEFFGFSFPRRAAMTLLAGQPEFGAILRATMRVENDRLRLRHPLLVVPTLDIAYPDPATRPELLCAALVGLTRTGAAGRNVVFEFFRSPGVPRRLKRYLRYDQSLLRQYADELSQYNDDFSGVGLASLLHTHLGLVEKDGLFDCNQAAYEFEDAISIDSDNAFAARQLAWCLLRIGELDAAEARARDTAKQFPDELDVLSDCAFIMSWCSPEGFLDAGDLYKELVGRNPEDAELDRRHRRYLEAELVVTASQGSFSDYQYREMRAPSFIWKVRRGAAKQYGRVLFNELRGALRDAEFNHDLIEGVAMDALPSRDDRLMGLIAAHAARHLYERWYHDNEDLDLDEVERKFREAVRLAPDEPFVHVWLGTFLKEARRNFAEALEAYKKARLLAGTSPQADIVEHPMILNDIALWHMDAVHRQMEPAEVGLNAAHDALKVALGRMEETGSRFRWPIDTQSRLSALALEFGVSLPEIMSVGEAAAGVTTPIS